MVSFLGLTAAYVRDGSFETWTIPARHRAAEQERQVDAAHPEVAQFGRIDADFDGQPEQRIPHLLNGAGG